MLAAIALPPHLAGIFPMVTASDYHDGWTYQGGAFEQWFNESWTSGLARTRCIRQSAQRRRNPRRLDQGRAAVGLSLLRDGLRPRSPSRRTSWTGSPTRTYDDYWRALSIEEHYGDSDSARATQRRLVRHFPARHAAQLRGPARRRGERGRAPGAAPRWSAPATASATRATWTSARAPTRSRSTSCDWFDHLLRGIDNGNEPPEQAGARSS